MADGKNFLSQSSPQNKSVLKGCTQHSKQFLDMAGGHSLLIE